MTIQNIPREVKIPRAISHHAHLTTQDKLLWATIHELSDTKLGTGSTSIWKMGKYVGISLSHVWRSYSNLYKYNAVKYICDLDHTVIIKAVLPDRCSINATLSTIKEESQEEEK